MKAIILNADDFGASAQVNAAILRAHQEGVLTSASLMVGGAAWEEAVQIARANPRLGVGLHLVVTQECTILPREEVPRITDAQGHLDSNLFRANFRYTFSRNAQRELRREMETQFARFASTGLNWSHVDGHQHSHMNAFVWDTLLDLCQQYGVSRLRLPREELRAHWRSGGVKPDLNVVASLIFRLLERRHRRRIPSQFFVCDRVYGHLQTGCMTAEYVIRLLQRLTGNTNEIYFHPGSPHARHLSGPFAGIEDVELAALLDPEVRERIATPEFCAVTYAEAEKMSGTLPAR